jgi:hypothetical protein
MLYYYRHYSRSNKKQGIIPFVFVLLSYRRERAIKNKMIVKSLLLLLLIFVVSTSGLAKEKIVQSLWAESPGNIDGLESDWPADVLNQEKKVEVNYAFKNDAENLYVLFVFYNPKYLSSLRQSGLTVWINTEGKKKEKYGINFKGKRVTTDVLIATIEAQKGPLPETEKERLRAKPEYFLYQGEIIDKKESILTAKALSGEIETPIFRSQQKNKVAAYELRIPLRVLEKLSTDMGMAPGETVKVGFEWGGMTKAMREAMMRRKAVSTPRGHEPVSLSETGTVSGVEEGPGSGGNPMSGTPRASRHPAKYSFWVDVKLAQSL